MLSTLNSPKDWIPCCIRTFLYLRSSYRCCGSLEQFWWTESEQHQGSLQLDRCCLSPLCLASKPVMVLIGFMTGTDIAKPVMMNGGGGENVTLD